MPKYSVDWFSYNENHLTKLLAPFKGLDNLDVLEVGVFEGRSTNFFCSEIFTGDGIAYTCVDPFTGSPEEDRMQALDSTRLHSRFISNISEQSHIMFNVRKEYSYYELPRLLKEGKRFDFIYIDGSHTSDNVLLDAIYAFKLLKRYGVVVFDDYTWQDKDRQAPIQSPKFAIDAFETIYKDSLQQILTGSQVGWQKTKAESY